MGETGLPLVLPDFVQYRKIPRLSRDMIVTEKIDGTNGVIYVAEDGTVIAGSRTRWITSTYDDNHGFAKWVETRAEELRGLGPGLHYGEWWGPGIQRGYGLKEKRWSLFNVTKWGNNPDLPRCCYVVPVLYSGRFNTEVVSAIVDELNKAGSAASPGFMRPEGIVIYHVQGNVLFKKTIEGDDAPKTRA